jgi:hypothetical protein
LEGRVLGNVTPSRGSLPMFIGDLDVCGTSGVVHAFGDLSTAYSRPRASVTSRALGTGEAREVGRRALARLRTLHDGGNTASLVNPALLDAVGRTAARATDRRISAQLARACRIARGYSSQIEQQGRLF